MRLTLPLRTSTLCAIALFAAIALAIPGASAAPRATVVPSTADALTQYTSKYYVVHTNLTREEARDLGAHMDAVFAEYVKRFASFKKRNDQAMDLYLFRTRDEYQNYLKKYDIDATNSGGMFLYQRKVQGLLTWVQGKSRSTTFETLQHEGFHQFAFAYIGPSLPIWVNEGIAQYFEDGILVGGEMTLGQANATRIASVKAAIRDNKAVDFDALLGMTDDEWGRTLVHSPQRSALLYDQSWSIVYFLIHGEGGKYRKALEEYLTKLSKGTEAGAAFRDVFGQDTAAFRKHWEAFALAVEPDPLNIAINRMEFLGQGLLYLHEQKKMTPLTIDALRTAMRTDRYTATRTRNGITIQFDSADDANFEYPRAEKGAQPFDLIASAGPAGTLPPRISAPGLKPTPTLIWSRDPDGKLVQDIEYK